jgi:hypothetical protein
MIVSPAADLDAVCKGLLTLAGAAVPVKAAQHDAYHRGKNKTFMVSW